MLMELVPREGEPADALERVLWLAEYRRLVLDELDERLSQAYFQARLEGRLASAVELGPHSRRTALRMTRQVNEARGRQIRWGDEFTGE